MATIQLTDGTTTLNLYDSSSYMILDQSWSPATGKRLMDGLAAFPYGVVTETMSLMITGSTVPDCLDKLHILTTLIDQADRWRRGEDVAAVIFKYKPTGSTMTNPLQWTVFGSPDMDQAVTVPARVEWIGNNDYKLSPVMLRFKRLGAGLSDEESDASSAGNNPSVLTATNTAVDLPSPLKLTLSNFTSAPWGGSFLLVTDDADKLDVFSVSTLTATGFTTQADASKVPYQGTNVLRYTPSDTDWHYSGSSDIKALQLSDTRKMAIYFNARRNSASVEAQVKIKITPTTGGYNTLAAVETQPVTLEYEVSGAYTQLYPQWYFAGILELPVDLSVVSAANLQIGVKASAATSNIDFDAVCLMDARDAMSQAIFLPLSDAAGLTPTLTADHQLLTAISPVTHITSGSIVLNVPSEGNRLFMGKAAEVAAIWLATSRDWSGPGYFYWCAMNAAGAAKLSNTLTSIRRPAYLVPQ